jgi:predicted nucleic acid-binding protein
LDALDEEETFISVISLGEIRRGIALLDAGRRRDALFTWLAEDLPQRFGSRVILVDQTVALTWGDLMAAAKRSGRGLSSMDGLIAATAAAHDLTLATRNIKDFEDLSIKLVDPWTM